jgi:PHD/YefM family antitoxin component YafN of YafNO toxin-antitoxin module
VKHRKDLTIKPIEVTAGLEWDKLLQQVKSEDVVLTKDGHAVALLSDFDDDEMYWYARERDPEFIASLKRAREQVAKGQTISHDELKKRLGIE